MAFLVDTNIFVDTHRRYYGLDIVPSFWVRTLGAQI